MLITCFFIAVIVLSIANGANDNFKGMATLWGSGTLDYRKALMFANVATFLGGCLAIYFGSELINTFSGKGMVDRGVLANPKFAMAFAFGAALTVTLATALKYPVSTTHAILGSLAGAAYAFSPVDVNFGVLFDKGFIPLLMSPLIAVVLTFSVWQFSRAVMPRPIISSLVEAPRRSFEGSDLMDRAHLLSGFSVCFARGVNDTPKIASIFLLANSFELSGLTIFFLIAVLMVVGGALFARDVAHVMSNEVTDMTPAHGFAGNIVTAFLVIFASNFGLGVSTTHVSVGCLFGIGALNGQAKWRKITQIVAAWVLTLPVGFMAAYLIAIFL